MKGRGPALLALLLGAVASAACGGGGEISERPLDLRAAAECTEERLAYVRSVAIAAIGSDGGDACLETSTCIDVAGPTTAAALEAALRDAPQPLLDLEAGRSWQIVIAGYLVQGCPSPVNEVRVCGEAYLTPDGTGELTFTLHCEFIGSTSACDDYDARPRPCP